MKPLLVVWKDGPRRSETRSHTRPSQGFLSKATTIALVWMGLSLPGADLVYQFNGDGVINHPTTVTGFTIYPGKVWDVNQIVTYHWNNGIGTQRSGTITIRRSDGFTLGPFYTLGTPGQGGVPNANWVANVNLRLTSGVYYVIDSDPNTWSQNARSVHAGFFIIRGTETLTPATGPSSGLTPGPPPPPSVVPFGGNCRGPGCTHPDLRAFGGNGPAGTMPMVSLHRPRIGSYYYFADLSPATTFGAMAAQCKATYNGTLVLMDDEPWFYYFIGRYATVACQR